MWNPMKTDFSSPFDDWIHWKVFARHATPKWVQNDYVCVWWRRQHRVPQTQSQILPNVAGNIPTVNIYIFRSHLKSTKSGKDYIFFRLSLAIFMLHRIRNPDGWFNRKTKIAKATWMLSFFFFVMSFYSNSHFSISLWTKEQTTEWTTNANRRLAGWLVGWLDCSIRPIRYNIRCVLVAAVVAKRIM